MTTIPHTTRRHRAPHRPLRLTRRGRIVRDLVAGAVVLTAALFASHVSVAYFAAALWAGHAFGITS